MCEEVLLTSTVCIEFLIIVDINSFFLLFSEEICGGIEVMHDTNRLTCDWLMTKNLRMKIED